MWGGVTVRKGTLSALYLALGNGPKGKYICQNYEDVCIYSV